MNNWVLRPDDKDLEAKLKELRIKDMREQIASGLVAAQTPEDHAKVNLMVDNYIKLIGTSTTQDVRYSQTDMDKLLRNY